MRTVPVLLILAYLIAGGTAQAQNPPAKPPSAIPSALHSSTKDSLRNVGLQSLASDIVGVVVGPDDTVWCQAAFNEVVPVASGRERIKQELRMQWGSPMPRLTGAKPVLFQKSGRIWFACAWMEKAGWGETLLSFDGKDFVEPANQGRIVGVGGNPTRKSPWLGMRNWMGSPILSRSRELPGLTVQNSCRNP